MKVLVLAPHADDETLGCGGTIARLADEGHEVFVGLVTGASDGEENVIAKSLIDQVRAELGRATKVLGVKDVVFENLPTVRVPDLPVHVVNAAVARIIELVRPELLFAPFPMDLHRDHTEIHYAASVAWRPYLELGHSIREVLCYEVPSETHLNFPNVQAGFIPNVWYDITSSIDRKIEAWNCFESQSQPFPLPRSAEAVRALATWRGSQIGVAAAEAFVSVRSLR